MCNSFFLLLFFILQGRTAHDLVLASQNLLHRIGYMGFIAGTWWQIFGRKCLLLMEKQGCSCILLADTSLKNLLGVRIVLKGLRTVITHLN